MSPQRPKGHCLFLNCGLGRGAFTVGHFTWRTTDDVMEPGARVLWNLSVWLSGGGFSAHRSATIYRVAIDAGCNDSINHGHHGVALAWAGSKPPDSSPGVSTEVSGADPYRPRLSARGKNTDAGRRWKRWRLAEIGLTVESRLSETTAILCVSVGYEAMPMWAIR